TDIPDPTSPYIPKSFVIALRDYISGVQHSSIPHHQERMRDFKNTITFGSLNNENCPKQVSLFECTQNSLRSSQLTIYSDMDFVSGMIQDFDLLIGPAINNYQMSRTTWAAFYVEKYMPIPKDYKPVTPVVLSDEDYTYDKIYSHFRGVLDCRFISIEHSRAVKGFIVDADCDY
ncbi:1696_t:CDS:2, partial [Racocetra fulgida]